MPVRPDRNVSIVDRIERLIGQQLSRPIVAVDVYELIDALRLGLAKAIGELDGREIEPLEMLVGQTAEKLLDEALAAAAEAKLAREDRSRSC